MKLKKILLYGLLLAFPLGAAIRIQIATSAYVYPVDVLLILIFSVHIITFLKKRNISKLYNSMQKSLYGFLAFCVLSLFLNLAILKPDQIMISGLYIIRIVLYSSLISVFRTLGGEFIKKYIYLSAAIGMGIVLFGYFQYFYYPSLRNLYYLGWDEHLYRMFSTFLDPNFLGAFFVLELLLLMSLFFEFMLPQNNSLHSASGEKTKSRSLISNLKYTDLKRILIKGILILSIFLTLIAVFLTYSRSSFIMLVVSIPFYLFLINKRKWLLFGLILFIFAIFLIPKQFNIEGMNPLRTASISARSSEYQNSLKIFSTSPLYGIGFNAYRYAQIREGFLKTNVAKTHSGAGVPNSYLLVIATTGIVGLGLFLNFLYKTIKILFLERRATLSKQGWDYRFYFFSAVIASVVGIMVHSLFENTFFYPFIMIWIFLMMGLAMSKES